MRVSGHVSHRRRADSYDMFVCGVMCTLSRKFSQFSLSKHYYIAQYRRNKYVFMLLRLPAALLPFCAIVVDIYLQHVFKVFQSTFSHVTVQFRCLTTELGNFDAKQSNLFALMVSTPFIVALMQMSLFVITITQIYHAYSAKRV